MVVPFLFIYLSNNLKLIIMKTNEEIISFIQEYKDRGEITIRETSDTLSVYCDIQSAFKTISDCKRLKTYLRNNGFESDRMGTYTRYTNSKGEVCTAYEQTIELNREYAKSLKFKSSFEVLNDLIIKNNGVLTSEIAIEAMEEYGSIYMQKYFANALSGQ